MTTSTPYIYTPEVLRAARACYELLRPWLETPAGDMRGDDSQANGPQENVGGLPSPAAQASTREVA